MKSVSESGVHLNVTLAPLTVTLTGLTLNPATTITQICISETVLHTYMHGSINTSLYNSYLHDVCINFHSLEQGSGSNTRI